MRVQFFFFLSCPCAALIKKKLLIWFFETTAPKTPKKMKTRRIVKIKIKQILCENKKTCFFTVLRFFDFSCRKQ